MGELKPIGSEKLSGDAKLKRILELTYYQSSSNLSKSAEIIKESKTGVYGVVKEKDGYYVKKGLNENSLDYIGGLFMKNKNKFTSYGEAFKKMEFLTEQEELQEATKYVLKQNKPAPAPQAEAPAPMPTNDPTAPPATPDPTALDSTDPSADPGDDLGAADPNADPNAGTEDPNDFMKVIEKFTGKLTQKLGVYKDKLESKDIKYVINMVLGSVDLDKLSDADETEILDNFDEEPSPEEGVPGDSGDEINPEPEAQAPPTEEGLGEIEGTTSLEELINTPFEDDDYSVFDDEDDDESMSGRLDFEDPKISKIASHDFERENPNIGDDEEEENMDSPLDSFDDEEGEESTEDNVKELDIDELTNMVNSTVKDSLSKYFS